MLLPPDATLTLGVPPPPPPPGTLLKVAFAFAIPANTLVTPVTIATKLPGNGIPAPAAIAPETPFAVSINMPVRANALAPFVPSFAKPPKASVTPLAALKPACLFASSKAAVFAISSRLIHSGSTIS